MRFVIALTIFFYSQILIADYLMVGDSVFTHRNQEIKRLIESDQKITIKNYAREGLWFNEIVNQYEKANPGPGDILIMDGGGDDIFGNAGNCRYNPNDACIKTVQNIINKLNAVISRLKASGTRLIFLAPYYTQGWNGQGYEKIIDYAIEKASPLCKPTENCFFIDPRADMTGRVLEWDGIHPNSEGTKILSRLIIREIENAK